SESDVTRIAWIGTGLLGSGMVRRLLARGAPLTVWNRTESKARALEGEGARVAASPAAAVAEAGTVHVILRDDASVDGILDQIVRSLDPAAIVIDHTTTLPEGTARRFERMRARRVRFVHAPVFMSPQMALEGKGLMMVSAAQAEYESCRAELEGMTGEAWYL